MSTTHFSSHNHNACIQDAVEKLETICKSQKLQLTPVRRRVFEILISEHKAMGAYDILDHLRREGLGSQPPVAYRALDFLVTHGFAHRVEKLNAFVACSHPGQAHSPAFLICRKCGTVAEAENETSQKTLNDAAASAGFSVEKAVIEVEGVCPECRT